MAATTGATAADADAGGTADADAGGYG